MVELEFSDATPTPLRSFETIQREWLDAIADVPPVIHDPEVAREIINNLAALGKQLILEANLSGEREGIKRG